MLRDFITAYTECALWSSSYDDGEHELAPETIAQFEADCQKFYDAHSETIDAAYMKKPNRYGGDVSAGHDFWLTRCGHGAGFWDGDWPEPAATILDDASKAAGNVELYVGDDGLIYAV